MTGMYTAILVITLSFICVTILDAFSSRIISKTMRRGSVMAGLFVAVALICEWLGVVTNGAAREWISLHRYVKLIEFCTSPFIGVAAAFGYGKAKMPKTVCAVLILHILFQIIAFNTPLMFVVDRNNIYHRSSLYFEYVLVFSLTIVYCYMCILVEQMKYYQKPDAVLTATLLFLTIGVALQMIWSDLRVEYMCAAIGNYLLYNHRCKIIFQLDGLTYLLNRRCYEKDIEKLNSSAVILNMDIDKFKHINDTYGHAAGDYYLKCTAKIIRKIYGKWGNCYRIGGDEFCVIIKRNFKKTEELNQLFCQSVNALREADGKAPKVSLGYAFYDRKTMQIEKAIEQADEMMYKHKNREQST